MKIKEKILKALKENVNSEKKKLEELAKSSRSDATGDDMKSEGKYDTRAIEAGYLASAHKARLEELEQELQLLESFNIKSFKEDEPVAMGALLDIELNGMKRRYFLSATAGGTMLDIDGEAILVISVFSPIGSSVIGLSAGDEFEVEMKGGSRIYNLLSVI